MRALLALLVLPAVLFAESTVPLFTIQRSLNKNEVVYELRLKGQKIDLDLPLEDYWLMRAKSGKREELTALERTRVYGYEIRKATEDAVTFVLVSMPDRPITVRRTDSGSFAATFPIQQKEAQLTTVYIQLRSGGILPRIDWIEVRGQDLKTQEFIYEKLSP